MMPAVMGWWRITASSCVESMPLSPSNVLDKVIKSKTIAELDHSRHTVGMAGSLEGTVRIAGLQVTRPQFDANVFTVEINVAPQLVLSPSYATALPLTV
ncbi:hypothetical protein [Pseudoduganella sp. HUAS MS19]